MDVRFHAGLNFKPSMAMRFDFSNFDFMGLWCMVVGFHGV